ncbi:hypothetical protein CSUB01_09434 [Colletotrichum sublineola]|uniref:Uncharacterized protein n=1 Tax=Colletotrichum sublineola TaxID=1173701 RepID=A0A066X040_COLSU|nr:hypothetical protein CSUB01_09434 [Colletotrichum sublineola]
MPRDVAVSSVEARRLALSADSFVSLSWEKTSLSKDQLPFAICILQFLAPDPVPALYVPAQPPLKPLYADPAPVPVPDRPPRRWEKHPVHHVHDPVPRRHVSHLDHRPVHPRRPRPTPLTKLDRDVFPPKQCPDPAPPSLLPVVRVQHLLSDVVPHQRPQVRPPHPGEQKPPRLRAQLLLPRLVRRRQQRDPPPPAYLLGHPGLPQRPRKRPQPPRQRPDERRAPRRGHQDAVDQVNGPVPPILRRERKQKTISTKSVLFPLFGTEDPSVKVHLDPGGPPRRNPHPLPPPAELALRKDRRQCPAQLLGRVPPLEDVVLEHRPQQLSFAPLEPLEPPERRVSRHQGCKDPCLLMVVEHVPEPAVRLQEPRKVGGLAVLPDHLENGPVRRRRPCPHRLFRPVPLDLHRHLRERGRGSRQR